MIFRSYFKKQATLIRNSYTNSSRNPIIELSYGNGSNTATTEVSRYVFNIDLDILQHKISSNTINKNTIQSHVLKIKNCIALNDGYIGVDFLTSKRASGFDLAFIKLEESFDEGTGYDYIYNDRLFREVELNKSAANWYNRKNPQINWTQQGVFLKDTDYIDDIILATGLTTANTTNQIIDGDFGTFELGISGITSDTTNSILTSSTLYTYSGSNSLLLKNNNPLNYSFYSPTNTLFNFSTPITVSANTTSSTVYYATGKVLDLSSYTCDYKRIYLDVSPSLDPEITLNSTIEYTSAFNAGVWNDLEYKFTVPSGFTGNTSYTLSVKIDGTSGITDNYNFFFDDFYFSTKVETAYTFTTAATNLSIITTQRFEIGNEDIDIDITDYVNGILFSGNPNNGICIAYSANTESLTAETRNVVTFFSKYTQTFFEPFLETTYDDRVVDENYCLRFDESNDFFFVSQAPVTSINKFEIIDSNDEIIFSTTETTAFTKLNYYNYKISYFIDSDNYQDQEIFYNRWHYTQNGKNKVLEKEFNISKLDLNDGTTLTYGTDVFINVLGIKQNEVVSKKAGLKRLIFKAKRLIQTKILKSIIGDIEFRIYVNQGKNQIDVIPFTKASKVNDEYFAEIDFSWFISHDYTIEMRGLDKNGIQYPNSNYVRFRVTN
jgi:hypothetical protein